MFHTHEAPHAAMIVWRMRVCWTAAFAECLVAHRSYSCFPRV